MFEVVQEHIGALDYSIETDIPPRRYVIHVALVFVSLIVLLRMIGFIHSWMMKLTLILARKLIRVL